MLCVPAVCGTTAVQLSWQVMFSYAAVLKEAEYDNHHAIIMYMLFVAQVWWNYYSQQCCSHTLFAMLEMAEYENHHAIIMYMLFVAQQ